MMDVDVLLERALSEVELLKEEEIFLVKDLFKGYEWNRIPVKDRLLLGTLFLHEVHKEKVPVIAVEKTSSHQQRYQRISG
uniref:single-stranded DNA-binding protein n=2 Tax=Proteiniclasticum ruminis TaxID=398199 RepID=UPI0028A0BF1B|nr:single-stranded DNA-binding protein [Proteiniclasticum ruminis]